MYLFNSYEEKMLTLGDFKLNSMQRYTDSLKDVFKQTLLNQNTIFRKQVHELHRLYGVQKTLMKDLVPMDLEKYNPWQANSQSLPPETRLTSNSIPTGGSTVSLSMDFLEGWKEKCHKFQQGPSDIQLPPGQYISLGDNNLPNKGKAVDINSLHGGDFSDRLELRLSLSLGVASRTKEDKRRSFYEKKTTTVSAIVIDLEESTEGTSDSGGKHASTIISDTITSRSMKKDLSHEIAESSSFVADSRCFQDQNYSNHGVKHHQYFPCENFLARKRQFVSYGLEHVDLNEVQLDDSSCQSPDESLNLALMNSSEDSRIEIQDRNSEICGRNEYEKSLIGLASVSMPQIRLFEDLGSQSENTKNEKDELMEELQNRPALGPNPECIVSRQVGCEKTVAGGAVLLCSDEIQITVEDEHPENSPASGKSSCILDNDARTVMTRESEIEPHKLDLSASDQFSGTHEGSHIAETLSGEQDQRSSDSNEIRHECYNRREESAAVDDLIQIAAESLILISSKTTPCYRESSTQAGSNDLDNEDNEQPQCSCDTFELMTLKLTESSADDYFVSSKPVEVSDLERKDFSIKLRRGRRLKDFQRDILPGLASLSRHEIREDINILEGVLRSREYKKMRAKMANGDTWCTPVRSRRSRLNYVGRKTFR